MTWGLLHVPQAIPSAYGKSLSEPGISRLRLNRPHWKPRPIKPQTLDFVRQRSSALAPSPGDPVSTIYCSYPPFHEPPQLLCCDGRQ